MHEYYLIKQALVPILNSAGFEESVEELRPDVFGSAYSVFVRNDTKLRIIWDGKDGWGYIQEHKDAEWIDLPVFVKEGTEASFAEELALLQERLKEIILQP